MACVVPLATAAADAALFATCGPSADWHFTRLSLSPSSSTPAQKSLEQPEVMAPEETQRSLCEGNDAAKTTCSQRLTESARERERGIESSASAVASV